ncbi:unnamed protein product [Ectocarpus sp. 6 AP-2014]
MQMSRYGRVFALSREDHSVAVFLGHGCVRRRTPKPCATTTSSSRAPTARRALGGAFPGRRTFARSASRVPVATASRALTGSWSAYRIIALLAENSRVHHADEYIYGDHGWKGSAQEAMKEGWNAVVSPEYVRSLEVNLNVDLGGLEGNTQAFEVLS